MVSLPGVDALGLGLALGLAASISPGPLLVLVVTSALRSGWRAGALASCTPLVSDAVVVAVTLGLLDHLPPRVLGVLGLAGAVFVVWSGARTIREARTATLPTPADPTEPAGPVPADTAVAVDAATAPGPASTAVPAGEAVPSDQVSSGPARAGRALRWRSSEVAALRQAVVVNLLSPHPWIAWATAIGPLTFATWRESSGAGVALVAGFYATLVGGKLAVAALVARGRRRLGDTGYRRALTAAGVLLVAAGIGLGVELFGYGM